MTSPRINDTRCTASALCVEHILEILKQSNGRWVSLVSILPLAAILAAWLVDITLDRKHANQTLVDALHSATYVSGRELQLKSSIKFMLDDMFEGAQTHLERVIKRKTNNISTADIADIVAIRRAMSAWQWRLITPAQISLFPQKLKTWDLSIFNYIFIIFIYIPRLMV